MQSDMIVVRQLPVIEEQLKGLKEQNLQRVEAVLAMPCNEDTVKALKKERAALNKEFAAYEQRRKEVKAQVLAPWSQFEAVYQDCVSDVFKGAESKLKSRINEVEDKIKQERREGVLEFFNEYRDSLGIDFVTFEQSGIAVTLTVSGKKLLEQAKAYLDSVKSDLELIDTQDHREEILVEYKRTLNVNQAITTVKDRHRRIAEEQRYMETRQAQEEAFAAVEAQVEQAAEEWAAPQPVEAPPEEAETPVNSPAPTDDRKYSVRFTVTATKGQIVDLKKFLKDGGYQYE